MLFYLSFIILIPTFLAIAWLYTAHVARTASPRFRNKRICLLIAHPDDEAMFFSPTLLALTDKNSGNHVKILCLSTGNADNLGQTRQQELLSSALILGLRSPADVFILDSPSFPDSMTTSWDANAVAEVLSSAFTPTGSPLRPQKPTGSPLRLQKPISSRTKNSSEAPVATIDVLLTFDSRGVSDHPNHTSLYRGARAWLSALMVNKNRGDRPVELYTLTTTNIFRKYISFLDAPLTMLIGALRTSRGTAGHKAEGKKAPPRIMFVNDLVQWRKAQRAMTKGHQSQMTWFRWGWIGVGRYMVVNDLKREKIA